MTLALWIVCVIAWWLGGFSVGYIKGYGDSHRGIP